jgi:hypothetical protein
MGDNHSRGLAEILQQNLGNEFKIQGTVKPGSDLDKVVNSKNSDLGKLTRKDVCIICGGTHDVGKNESKNGLCHLRKFIDKHKQTNMLVLSIPHRHRT